MDGRTDERTVDGFQLYSLCEQACIKSRQNGRICAYVRWTLFNCHDTPLHISSFLELSFIQWTCHLLCSRHLSTSRPGGERIVYVITTTGPENTLIRRVILRNGEIDKNTGFLVMMSGRVYHYCLNPKKRLCLRIWEYPMRFPLS